VCFGPLQEEFFLRFAEFEEIVKEYDRARAIYKYALDQLPRGAAQQLYTRFNTFEKQHGSRWVHRLCLVVVFCAGSLGQDRPALSCMFACLQPGFTTLVLSVRM
jgi:hypothetical protein